MRAYGWRAYAVPVLAILTLAALLTVVRREWSSGATHLGSATKTAAQTSSGSAGASTAEGEQIDPSAPSPTGTFTPAGNGALNILPGSSAVLGTGGPVKTFVIEYEGGTNLDPAEFASYVEDTFADPRSWGAGGQMRFQRVDGSAPFDFRVALISPNHVESLCPGYGTEGYTSCRFGDRAVINLARWSVGVPFYDGHLDEYRQYVINHEVGHYLGHGHEGCPGPGALAPVMLQQTLKMDGCVVNPWPYPHGPTDNPANPN
ncbi:DUF3152 domain-containing protein [Antricoccus suffuscus]|uniref:DUF3152 domain-containing protein n=1 Tax=Antricoccus suffuscus TaxID=1629062 RepID=UPI001EDF1D53|nr:DUF3152 domain-containing protein [Antricoccus suffuscus]